MEMSYHDSSVVRDVWLYLLIDLLYYAITINNQYQLPFLIPIYLLVIYSKSYVFMLVSDQSFLFKGMIVKKNYNWMLSLFTSYLQDIVSCHILI